MKRLFAMSFAFVICVSQDISATSQHETSRFQEMLASASATYRSLVQADGHEVPESVLSKAKCVAVFPKVLSGAIVVGGLHGDGLASCKASQGGWSQPAAVSVRGGSLGIQAGGASSELLLFFVSDEAAAALKRGKVSFGADMGVLVGKRGKSFETGTAGVVSYARHRGAFLGAALTGTRVGRDRDELEEYYGEKADFSAIIEGQSRPDTAEVSASFLSLLPKE